MPCEIFISIRAAGHWEAAQDFNGLIAVSCMFPSLLFITDDNCGFVFTGLGQVSPESWLLVQLLLGISAGLDMSLKSPPS